MQICTQTSTLPPPKSHWKRIQHLHNGLSPVAKGAGVANPWTRIQTGQRKYIRSFQSTRSLRFLWIWKTVEIFIIPCPHFLCSSPVDRFLLVDSGEFPQLPNPLTNCKAHRFYPTFLGSKPRYLAPKQSTGHMKRSLHGIFIDPMKFSIRIA